ncbi:MAG: hypothetical protein ACT4QE_02445 [Anaerolineales bacterium]
MIDIANVVLASIVLITLLVEVVLSATWNQSYFTIGLPIFSQLVSVTPKHPKLPSTDQLESHFQHMLAPSLVFKKLTTNQYGFRESMFEFKFFAFRYTPIMHGLLQFDSENKESQVVVTGYANWTVSVLLTIGLASTLPAIINSLPGSLGGLLIVGLFLSVLYVIQAVRFRNVALVAAQLWAQRTLLPSELPR